MSETAVDTTCPKPETEAKDQQDQQDQQEQQGRENQQAMRSYALRVYTAALARLSELGPSAMGLEALSRSDDAVDVLRDMLLNSIMDWYTDLQPADLADAAVFIHDRLFEHDDGRNPLWARVDAMRDLLQTDVQAIDEHLRAYYAAVGAFADADRA